MESWAADFRDAERTTQIDYRAAKALLKEHLSLEDDYDLPRIKPLFFDQRLLAKADESYTLSCLVSSTIHQRCLKIQNKESPATSHQLQLEAEVLRQRVYTRRQEMARLFVKELGLYQISTSQRQLLRKIDIKFDDIVVGHELVAKKPPTTKIHWRDRKVPSSSAL